MNRGDKFLLAGILLVSLLILAALYSRFSRYSTAIKAAQAVVVVQGKVIRRVTLPVPGKSSFVVRGRIGPSTVEIDGAQVRIREAPCSGQVCVRQGWISHPGQSVVCIPGEIIIRIEGANPLDAVTR
ncbi:MAG: NusG domain II-containing protein [Deltaproteobacteria bacterium]|jgi:hypothetical protein|nr:NusG domain II-containing protein [Deltaproteobacteria bacterium]